MFTSISLPDVTPPRRIFKYLDHTIEDPGPEHTVEQVRAALVTYFPELSRATTEEETLSDGRVQITFHKQATTKGSVITELAERLAQLPPAEEPWRAVLDPLGPQPTLQALLDHAAGITTALHTHQQHDRLMQKVMERCRHLPPTPLPCLPLGF